METIYQAVSGRKYCILSKWFPGIYTIYEERFPGYPCRRCSGILQKSWKKDRRENTCAKYLCQKDPGTEFPVKLRLWESSGIWYQRWLYESFCRLCQKSPKSKHVCKCSSCGGHWPAACSCTGKSYGVLYHNFALPHGLFLDRDHWHEAGKYPSI